MSDRNEFKSPRGPWAYLCTQNAQNLSRQESSHSSTSCVATLGIESGRKNSASDRVWFTTNDVFFYLRHVVGTSVLGRLLYTVTNSSDVDPVIQLSSEGLAADGRVIRALSGTFSHTNTAEKKATPKELIESIMKDCGTLSRFCGARAVGHTSTSIETRPISFRDFRRFRETPCCRTPTSSPFCRDSNCCWCSAQL